MCYPNVCPPPPPPPGVLSLLPFKCFFFFFFLKERISTNTIRQTHSGTSILQLIYGAMLVHRKRRGTLRGGNYAPAVNPANGGIETGLGGGGGHVQEPVYGGPLPTYNNSTTPGYYHQPQQPQSGTEYKSPYSYGQATATPAPGSYELDSRPQQYA